MKRTKLITDASVKTMTSNRKQEIITITDKNNQQKVNTSKILRAWGTLNRDI